jgi:hypothetical protein
MLTDSMFASLAVLRLFGVSRKKTSSEELILK